MYFEWAKVILFYLCARKCNKLVRRIGKSLQYGPNMIIRDIFRGERSQTYSLRPSFLSNQEGLTINPSWSNQESVADPVLGKGGCALIWNFQTNWFWHKFYKEKIRTEQKGRDAQINHTCTRIKAKYCVQPMCQAGQVNMWHQPSHAGGGYSPPTPLSHSSNTPPVPSSTRPPVERLTGQPTQCASKAARGAAGLHELLALTLLSQHHSESELLV